ncbi:hypothetical protein RvY_10020 [Ramazzottius varieornatus]|uniref:Rhodanese domain-containing protein n=1 Tax=Ramazzottius varieornatus TaxID=947166 RepID=A0A1D1VDH7_RAMVA|nr:hypothetical protein RvY_10020 [Ramazzottius varieornatus]
MSWTVSRCLQGYLRSASFSPRWVRPCSKEFHADAKLSRKRNAHSPLLFRRAGVIPYSVCSPYLPKLTPTLGYRLAGTAPVSHSSTEMVNPDDIVSYEYVKELAESGKGIIIDVRRPEERDTDGSIPSTVNIPLNDIAEAFAMSPEELSSKYGLNIHDVNDEIIFHCRSGARSQQAMEIARNNGYRSAKNYKGSITEWNAKTKR